MVAIEFDDYTEQLCSFLEAIPPPKAIVVVSAHWITNDEIKITSSEYPEQLYDFQGFPETLNKLTYPCFGQPQMAESMETLLSEAGFAVQLDSQRGLDHGVWVPLYVTFPNAEVPVLQVSIPKKATPKDLLKMGNALTSLRKSGVLLIGSGGLVHNITTIKEDKYAEADQWALDIDEWFKKQFQNHDIDALLNYEKHLSQYKEKMSSIEHLLPAFFVLGCMNQRDHYVDIFEGFHHGNLSMRCFAYARND
jgi:4,5-DOPA dioxygenase extradiol